MGGSMRLRHTWLQHLTLAAPALLLPFAMNCGGIPTSPIIIAQPMNQQAQVGGSASFSVTALASPVPTYQWYKNGQVIQGATQASYSLSNIKSSDHEAQFHVVITNNLGTATSQSAKLTVKDAAPDPNPTTFAIEEQPKDQSTQVGGSVTFAVKVKGSGNITYQWKMCGGDIPGATSSSFTYTNAKLEDNGNRFNVEVSNGTETLYSAYAVINVNGDPNTTAPVITTQPQSQTITLGQSVTFSASASGTPTPTFQWHRDGNALNGETGKSYTFTPTLADNGASFTLVATNSAGSVASDMAILTVKEPTSTDIAPSITAQPKDQKISEGENASFSVTATGSPSPTFQWRKNGQAISGATSAFYTHNKASLTDNSAKFDVVVTNKAGSATSNAATLTVTAPVSLEITQQPAPVKVTAGKSATFTVKATGNPTPSYQWQRDSEAIDGATQASYTLSNVQASDNGAVFKCLVYNSSAKRLSDPATLTVETPAPDPTPVTYTVTFLAGSGGTLNGIAKQTVKSGESTSPIEAIANSGYSFKNWTGTGFVTTTVNPMIIDNVTRNITVTANFAVDTPAEPTDSAHKKHMALANVKCTDCHSNGGAAVSMSATYKAKSGTLAYNATAGTCSGVTCHGGVTTPKWSGGTIATSTNCKACHTSGTTQYNGYKGMHSAHSRYACTDCHVATKLATVHFVNLQTPQIEGKAGTTIGAKNKSYDQTQKSCVTSCHGSSPISW